MKDEELEQILGFYGYDLLDLTSEVLYDQSQGKTYGVRDRRSKQIIATYTTSVQIQKWLVKEITRARNLGRILVKQLSIAVI